MSRDILLNQIDPDPEQPRKHFDEGSLAELAQSIQANGLAVPILVRPVGERFMIVHGERRYRAVTMLNWESIPAEVRDIDPAAAKWLALIENIQRDDLLPTEEALAYKAMLTGETTQEQLGQRIGKSQSHIATKLRLLKLPQEVQSALDKKAITEGHAKQLLRLDDTEAILNLYQETRDRELSVKALSQEVSAMERILEARRVRAELDNAYDTLKFSDEDLLLALGCEPFWSDSWRAEDFKHCGDRLVGIFARFMYHFGQRTYTTVWAENFTESNRIWFDMATKNMRRELAESINTADLIFVHFPAHIEDPARLVRYITQNTKEESVIVFRCGPERVGVPDGPSATADIARVQIPFRDAGFMPGIWVCCTLAEILLPDYLEAEIIRKANKKDGMIECYEVWIVYSRSKEALEQGHFVYS